jgi:hypothetical protein
MWHASAEAVALDVLDQILRNFFYVLLSLFP